MGSCKPHAVLVPCPLQGHVKMMLKLAKLLNYKGFHITFVNTEFNHKRFLKSRGPNSLDGFSSFQFETIPDGIPLSENNRNNIDATQDIPSLCISITNHCLPPFRDLLVKLISSKDPPVTCIVSDAFMPFTITASQEVGVPLVMFATMSASGFMGFNQLHVLKEKGFTPPKEESDHRKEYLETAIDWIPGMKGIRLKDLPGFLRIMDPDDMEFNFIMGVGENATKAPAILLHTFDALEQDALNGFSSIFPRVYAVGPLQLLLNQIQEDHSLKSIGYNLWKEETGCLQWLASKEVNSVVYVNFGSITVMTAEQLVEFAMGLASSKQQFLWIIRPDIVIGKSAILPPEFAAEAQKRGFIASWCPQEDVLNHPSIGGFLTHSGWGSTIESLSAGVPMICWPFFADQPMNCRYTCTEWGVGMEIDNDVKREEVGKLVRQLMVGKKGKKMREKAMEWKKLAEDAAAPYGSSSINLDKFINEMLLSKQVAS